ncbi:MAG: hypothetical protein JWO52_8185 [Gammaproteobacteria bacterium]|jgi:hypothetical protein|nr:hypothetical protein [Gammaproteobacteria bacterium]
MAIKGSCHVAQAQLEISEAPANVNLLDEFDLAAVPVRTIDGKSLW